MPEGGLELTNLSESADVTIQGRECLGPGETQLAALPVALVLGARKTVTICRPAPVVALESLDEATRAPGQSSVQLAAWSESPLDCQPGVDSVKLVEALQATIDVFQSATIASELFDSAISGAIAFAASDSVRILLYRDGTWQTAVARGNGNSEELPAPSRHVLRNVLDKKRTFWDSGLDRSGASDSLATVHAVIAAPILDPQGRVIGALYVDRRSRSDEANSRAVTKLDARLIELLACSVAAGLARQAQEDTTRRLRLQFEQFFTPELARHLESHPDLLEGREAEVTLLFCDIRGFSRVAEKIGAARTFAWINDVMGTLSEAVIRHDGVLVDYIGDELMAMWGAPQAQPDHAELACRAAREMLTRLPEVNARWQAGLGEPVDIGIGLNSGVVRAGNTGSTRKFKYGPLGNTVNLASRVQGATKYLKAQVLATGDTVGRLTPDVPRRRLCAVRVVNIREPVHLWELLSDSDGIPPTVCADYERALSAFERCEFREAARLLSGLQEAYPDDGPSLVLLSRVVKAMVEGPDKDHPVWSLPGK